MLTRPLDLASKLRPEPKNFDAVFLINGGLILLFFQIFGSRFVLAPGLGIDFQITEVPGIVLGKSRTTNTISVKRDGLIFAERGQVTMAQLREWLRQQAVGIKQPTLLVRLDANVTTSVVAEIYTAAHEAGFNIVLGAEALPASTLPERAP